MGMTSKDLSGRLLDSHEAARFLGLSERTLWGLANSGRITVVRPSPRAVRYRLADLHAYADSCTVPAERNGRSEASNP
jgi:excisionase family DNA binding protein